jgi:hypothetical protein
MSRFEPNSQKTLPPEYWEAAADLESSGNGIDHIVIVTGGCLSLFLSMYASPGVGLFTLLLIVWSRFKSQHDAARAGVAIKNDGLVAPFLRGDEFRQYVAAVGEDEVKRQIAYAQAHRYRLSLDAAVLMKKDNVVKALPPAKSSHAEVIDVPAAETVAASSVTPDEPAVVASTSSHLPPFQRDRILQESKGLMIIGDMGSAKTSVIRHIAGAFEGYQIIVFDPHWNPINGTDWGKAHVLTKMPEIYHQMRLLLDSLDQCDMSKVLVICDEWLEIRGANLNRTGKYKGLAEDFIRLFSTKPRKFNKLGCFILHSPNVEAAGLDSFLRENYLKIYLGRLAKKEFPHIKDVAYPCVVEDEQFEHPTHGHYTQFKPSGNAPRNVAPLKSAPVTIPIAGENKASNQQDIRARLEKLWLSSADTGIDTELEAKIGDTDADISDTSIDTSIDTSDTPTPKTVVDTGGSSDTEGDTAVSRLYTPAKLPARQITVLVNNMKASGLSQTQIIQALWSVVKNQVGWKAAYNEFKELMGGDDKKNGL